MASPGRGITSLARTFFAHGKLAKASDDDRFSLLKSGPEECKNPFEQVGRLSFRNAGLLMNASGNIRFCHAVSFSFGKNLCHGSLERSGKSSIQALQKKRNGLPNLNMSTWRSSSLSADDDNKA